MRIGSREPRPRWTSRVLALVAVSVTSAAFVTATAGTGNATTAATSRATTAATSSAPTVAHSAAGRSFVNSKGDRCHRSTASAAVSACVHPVLGQAAVARHVRALGPVNQALRRAALSRSTRPGAVGAAVPVAPSQCTFGSGSYIVEPDRFTSCTDIPWELYFDNKVNGIVQSTGSLELEDWQWASYNVRSLSWTHGLTLTVYKDGQGTLANGSHATVSSACGVVAVNCAVSSTLGTPAGQAVALSPGATINEGWTETDIGSAAAAAGNVDFLNSLGVSFAGAADSQNPAWTFNDDAYLAGRCDSVVPSNSVGCVNQAFTPTLGLSLATSGSSAAMVQWAEQNLSGHWGLKGKGQPLHRLADSIVSSDNRNVICDNSYKQLPAMNTALIPYKDVDSCDEYPFASSYESGAMPDGANGQPKPFVTTGAKCAQVAAVQTGTDGNEPADWPGVTIQQTPAGTEPCVRGHIPNLLNGRAGSDYGNLTSANRLLDKDGFWVAVGP